MPKGRPDEAVAEPRWNCLVYDLRSEGPLEGRPDRKVGKGIGEKMSAEGAALRAIELDFTLCRTFGAHFGSIHYPDLTVGPNFFRPYGPDAKYIGNPRLFCNSPGRAPANPERVAGELPLAPIIFMRPALINQCDTIHFRIFIISGCAGGAASRRIHFHEPNRRGFCKIYGSLSCLSDIIKWLP
jgi:hypothetical protein